MSGTIYLIINKNNGHKYIGKTTDSMDSAWKEHIILSNRMNQDPIHLALRKYKPHMFLLKLIEETDDNLDDRYNYWIERYNPEYNSEQIEEIEEEVEEIKEVIIPKKKSKRPEKTKGFTIQGMNLETGEIRTWESAREAARDITGDAKKNSNILRCARNGYKYYDHVWRIIEDFRFKKVKAVNRKTWQEFHFDNIADVFKKTGVKRDPRLKKVLESNGRLTWKGYMWFYT
jgi:hypothetical protein